MQEWLIEQYLRGRVPLPAPVVQGVLKAGMELYTRFAPAMRDLPPEWGGATGPIAEQSADLMRIHYDKPAALFENFLGETMKYSMGLWETGAGDLDDAQRAMMDDLCDKAGIADGEEVLDIGCGFGSFAAHVLQRYPRARVVGFTLSEVQYRYMTDKQSEPGHPLHDDRFRVLKEDFAHARFDRQFDRIVSIGVFEHVRNLRAALDKVAGLLKPEGRCLLHYIVYNKITRQMAERDAGGFISKYIFPGGGLWPYQELFKHQDALAVERSWFLNGHNYRRTLEAWLANFRRNRERIRRIEGLDEQFLRTWEFYLMYCIAIFGSMDGGNVGNGQYLLRHDDT